MYRRDFSTLLNWEKCRAVHAVERKSLVPLRFFFSVACSLNRRSNVSWRTGWHEFVLVDLSDAELIACRASRWRNSRCSPLSRHAPVNYRRRDACISPFPSSPRLSETYFEKALKLPAVQSLRKSHAYRTIKTRVAIRSSIIRVANCDVAGLFATILKTVKQTCDNYALIKTIALLTRNKCEKNSPLFNLSEVMSEAGCSILKHCFVKYMSAIFVYIDIKRETSIKNAVIKIERVASILPVKIYIYT